jgi:hypothetical protein
MIALVLLLAAQDLEISTQLEGPYSECSFDDLQLHTVPSLTAAISNCSKVSAISLLLLGTLGCIDTIF